MIHVVTIALLGIFAAAQQPQVREQELSKPGQSQPQQPAKPAPSKTEQKPAPAPAQPVPQPPAPKQPEQPVPVLQPTAAPAPAPATAQPAVAGQHVPAPEETERGQQGKPVAAFWIILPGK